MQKNYDGNIFHTDKVQKYLEAIDEHCRTCLESVFLEFKNHSDPIILVPDMKTFIDQATVVFGDT